MAATVQTTFPGGNRTASSSMGGREVEQKIKGPQTPLSRAQTRAKTPSLRNNTSSPKAEVPQTRHEDTQPKQHTEQKEEGRRGCQRNPEGRKLDRQTEANACFIAPERHTLDFQTLRDVLFLCHQEAKTEAGPLHLPKPNSSSPRHLSYASRPKSYFSSSYLLPRSFFGSRQEPPSLGVQRNLQGTVWLPHPQPSP